MKGYLILEDGQILTGENVGANREVISEFVFNTSMTGYVEVLTDPSYAGQSVVMTYPLIGNYGVCLADQESAKPQVAGFIVNELIQKGSNFRKNVDLKDYLIEHAPIESFVVIDDIYFPDFGQFENRLVLTDFDEGGLTMEHAQEAIYILNHATA